MADMGIFRTSIRVESLIDSRQGRDLDDVMVDTGSEYNWVSASVLSEIGVVPVRVDRFETADGRVVERDVGFAMIHAGGRFTATPVVFANETDMTLLGAIGLEGLNLRVDLTRRELVPAGPMPAARVALARRAA